MIEISAEKFNRALARFQYETKSPVEKFLKSEARLLIKELVFLTPPNSSANVYTGPLNSHRKDGEKAVESDVSKIFITLDYIRARKGDDIANRLEQYLRTDTTKFNNTLKKMKIGIPGITKQEMPAHHARSRNKYGRTLGTFRVYVEDTRHIKSLIKKLSERVGFAKAGWKSAAVRFGFGLPAWIQRHNRGGIGYYIDRSGEAKEPYIEVGNLVKYAQKHNQSARVVSRAITRRAEKLEARLTGYLAAKLQKSFNSP